MKPRDNPALRPALPHPTMPSERPTPTAETTQGSPWPGALAAHLREHTPPAAVLEGVAARLRLRALASARAHQSFKVTRREDGPWQTLAQGVRMRQLYLDRRFSVECLQLAAGAALPWHESDRAQEVLLLRGSLNWQDQPMRALGHGVRGSAQASIRAAAGGAEVYLRRLRVELDALVAAESHWWQQADGQRVDDALEGPWSGEEAGMQIRPLAQTGAVASMLIRLAPGASAPDHAHPIAEDCMMIEGELFLGDILLRAMDYQLAPTEAPHLNVSSDTGALFFVHGALPG